MTGFGSERPEVPEGLGNGIVEHFRAKNAGTVAVLREMAIDEPDMLLVEDWKLLAQAKAIERFQGEADA